MMDNESDSREQFAVERLHMIDEQIRSRGISNKAVLDAVARVPRELFVPDDMQPLAYDDRALSIGLGQTISQPYIVAYMTDKLHVTGDCRVLEIGTGTGYQTAILAHLAAHVFTVERLPELSSRAGATLSQLGINNVTTVIGDGTLGLAEHAPYDRILVTAGAPRVPTRLVDQLSPEGILVLPVGGETGQRIVRVVRHDDRTEEESLVPCRFVKLFGQDGWYEPPADK